MGHQMGLFILPEAKNRKRNRKRYLEMTKEAGL
jgi:hypothetical protein